MFTVSEIVTNHQQKALESVASMVEMSRGAADEAGIIELLQKCEL